MVEDTTHDGRTDAPFEGVSKRDLMKLAGIGGLGMLLGGAPAAADGEDGKGAGLRDVDGDGLLEAPNHEGFDVAEYIHDPKETRRHTQRRPLVSSERTELYVDPDGDDDAEGSEEAPIATLGEAFARMPWIINHRFRIHINEGVNDNDGASATTPRSIVWSGYGDPDFHIVGDADNPENHVIEGPDWINFSLMGAQPLRAVHVEGVQFDAKLQNYRGTLGLENCILNSSPRPWNSSCVGGYQGQTIIHSCEIGGAAEHVAELSQMAMVQLGGNTGSVSDSIVQSYGYGGIAFDLGTNSVSAPRWINDRSPNPQSTLTVRGNAEVGELAGENWWNPDGDE